MPGAGWAALGAGLQGGAQMWTQLRQQAIENAMREQQMKLEEEDRKRQREDMLRRTRQEDLQRMIQLATIMKGGQEVPPEMAGAFTPEQQAFAFTPPIKPEEARLPSAGFKPGMALPPMPGQPPSMVPQVPMQRGPMVPGLEAGKRYTRDIFQAPSVQAQELRSQTTADIQPFLAEIRANSARDIAQMRAEQAQRDYELRKSLGEGNLTARGQELGLRRQYLALAQRQFERELQDIPPGLRPMATAEFKRLIEEGAGFLGLGTPDVDAIIQQIKLKFATAPSSGGPSGVGGPGTTTEWVIENGRLVPKR